MKNHLLLCNPATKTCEVSLFLNVQVKFLAMCTIRLHLIGGCFFLEKGIKEVKNTPFEHLNAEYIHMSSETTFCNTLGEIGL